MKIEYVVRRGRLTVYRRRRHRTDLRLPPFFILDEQDGAIVEEFHAKVKALEWLARRRPRPQHVRLIVPIPMPVGQSPPTAPAQDERIHGWGWAREIYVVDLTQRDPHSGVTGYAYDFLFEPTTILGRIFLREARAGKGRCVLLDAPTFGRGHFRFEFTLTQADYKRQPVRTALLKARHTERTLTTEEETNGQDVPLVQ